MATISKTYLKVCRNGNVYLLKQFVHKKWIEKYNQEITVYKENNILLTLQTHLLSYLKTPEAFQSFDWTF